MSRTGQLVAFMSSATNLVSGDTNTCPPVFDQEPGRYHNVFVRDRVAGTTVRVNVASDGAQANERRSDAAISENGQVVAFFSAAGEPRSGRHEHLLRVHGLPGNCPDIFVHGGSV